MSITGQCLSCMKASVTWRHHLMTRLRPTCAWASNRPRLKKAAGSADCLWCAGVRQKYWNLAPQLLALCLTIVSLGLTQGEWHFQPHVPTGLNVASFVVGLACGVLLFLSAFGFSVSDPEYHVVLYRPTKSWFRQMFKIEIWAIRL